MTSYKNNKPVTFTQEKNFPDDLVRDSKITLNSHTGTHIDAPSHFLADGANIEATPLQNLVGPCRVLDLTNLDSKITSIDLEPFNIQSNEILLLKTKNSLLGNTDPFIPNFVYLDKTGAQFLANKKIKTVGIDYLGIEREQPNHETHCILLEQRITIIEGLRLRGAMGGVNYVLFCLPLALQGLEAAPARAILVTDHTP